MLNKIKNKLLRNITALTCIDSGEVWTEYHWRNSLQILKDFDDFCKIIDIEIGIKRQVKKDYIKVVGEKNKLLKEVDNLKATIKIYQENLNKTDYELQRLRAFIEHLKSTIKAKDLLINYQYNK